MLSSAVLVLLASLVLCAEVVSSHSSSIPSPEKTCLSRHLVVLCHGLSGTSEDLYYLSESLSAAGATVFRSAANSKLSSFNGVKEGAEKLVEEINALVKSDSFNEISFVGNSLGGLYARYAVHLLTNSSQKKIAGLKPSRFVLIASPSLGVRNFTYVDDMDLYVPDILKRSVAYVMRASGQDLFATDAPLMRDSLLYKMAVHESFLAPLRLFEKRLLYANLNNDFVVPLGTAGFMHREQVIALRKEFEGRPGIVHTLTVPPNPSYSAEALPKDTDPLSHMIEGLNSCGWEKRIVNFPGLIPYAHNKICALNRSLYGPLNDLFAEGQFVMDDASRYICSSVDNKEVVASA